MKQTIFRPILFSTAMVQAIEAGRKTQTRRIMKEQPVINPEDGAVLILPELFKLPIGITLDEWKKSMLHTCPYGIKGDVLWVRESYCPGYFEGGGSAYKAEWNSIAGEYVTEPKWKPSIHMPKGACRYFLEVVDVRIERLNEITEEDAIKEGVSRYPSAPIYGYKNYYNDQAGFLLSAKKSFESLWAKINGDDAWDENPFVWVVEFKRVDRPVGFMSEELRVKN